MVEQTTQASHPMSCSQWRMGVSRRSRSPFGRILAARYCFVAHTSDVATRLAPSARGDAASRVSTGRELRACNLIFFFRMSPILTSLLLGLTAAGANVFGGAIIVQKHWERSYLRYFVALGAGFMLATALVEMVPESIHLRGAYGGFFFLS